jgi:hypothetical protein
LNTVLDRHSKFHWPNQFLNKKSFDHVVLSESGGDVRFLTISHSPLLPHYTRSRSWKIMKLVGGCVTSVSKGMGVRQMIEKAQPNEKPCLQEECKTKTFPSFFPLLVPLWGLISHMGYDSYVTYSHGKIEFVTQQSICFLCQPLVYSKRWDVLIVDKMWKLLVQIWWMIWSKFELQLLMCTKIKISQFFFLSKYRIKLG